jgi:prefoldin subunit 5
MNATRRKAIQDISEKANNLLSQLREVKQSFETVRDDEQEYHDNLSESAQEGDKGEDSERAIESIEEAIGVLEDAVESLDEKVVNIDVE